MPAPVAACASTTSLRWVLPSTTAGRSTSNHHNEAAAGSGTSPEAINKLLKMHRGMADMMKAMGGAKRGPMAGLANALGMGGGGGMPSAEEMQKMAEKMQQGGGLPPGMPGLPPNIPGLPGLGGAKLPGLGGFPGLGKKK